MNEKLERYQKAKEAYYQGQQIMSDIEFDELEKELGLENKSYIGSKSSQKYTEHHPVMMGSLSKVQIHEKNNYIDWPTYTSQLNSYLLRNHSSIDAIVTPKFDGCSFEVYVKDHTLASISSRGDGQFGVDLTHLVKPKLPKHFETLTGNETFLLRGEILVDKTVFLQSYSEFVNPRSFVSSVVTSDKSKDKDYLQKVKDLSIVIYDYKVLEENEWIDKDFTELPAIYKELIPQHYTFAHLDENDMETFIKLYDEFADYRKVCNYALDGIVIKPIQSYRQYEKDDARPKDCVAIKFIPQLSTTKVEKIEWNLSKTHELIPTIYVEPVTMDGKVIRKCSGYHYGYIVDNHISKGVEVVLSLAGDIIPFLYKIVNNDCFSMENIDLNEQDTFIEGCHLYVNLSEKEKAKLDFISSAETLSIPGIGPAIAESIFAYISSNVTDDETNEFFGLQDSTIEYPTNILEVSPEDIYIGAGQKKVGKNAKDNFMKFIKNLTLSDVIQSCNFRFCGKAVSSQIAQYLLQKDYDFSHLANEGYSWVFDKESTNFQKLNGVLQKLGMSIEDFNVDDSQYAQENLQPKTYVILTGEPTQYQSKADFLAHHPEYELTTSWKKVQVVFTNSMESNTGKMKKAREKKIEIRLY